MLNLVSEWKFDGAGKNDGEIADATYAQDTWGSNNGAVSYPPIVKTGLIVLAVLVFGLMGLQNMLLLVIILLCG